VGHQQPQHYKCYYQTMTTFSPLWNFLKYTVDVLKARCISLLKQKHGVGRLFLYCVTDMERIFTNQWNNKLRMKH